MKLALFCFFAPLMAFSQVEILKRPSPKTSFDNNKTQLSKVTKETYRSKKSVKETPKTESLNSQADPTKKTDDLIRRFINSNSTLIGDYTFSLKIRSGTALRGVILNSIVSTNLDSPLLVRVDDGMGVVPDFSEFLCFGKTKHKRVFVECSKLIMGENETLVSALLLNKDGSAGLTGEFYSGQEEYVAGAIATGALTGVLEASMSKVSTPYGDLIKDTSANKVLGGAIGGLDVTKDIIEGEMKTKEPKVAINAGKEVIVFFTSGVIK